MKNLYIVGAGGFGRELLNLILDIHAIAGQRWNIMGFLDDTEAPLAGKTCDFPVRGTILDYHPKPDDVLALGIASPHAKRKLVPLLKARGAFFETCIHPYAYLGRHNSIGEGAIIGGGFSMSVNVSLGDYVTILGSGMGHDVKVGDYSTISACCNIMGNVTIGSQAFISGNVAIAPHVAIGERAYVCIGSVVIKNVKAGAKVLGNPAREINFQDPTVSS